MSDKTTVQKNGIGVFGFLTIIFVVAKLFHVISWSWWLVLLPLYGPIVLTLAVTFVVVLVVAVVSAFK